MITSLEDFQKDVIVKTNFEHFNDDGVKCINVDEVFAKGHSIVDIIFYLRLVGVPSGNDSRKPVTKPIICTGFLPPQYLIRKDPQYAILYSPGVSYVQLPHDHDVTKTPPKLLGFDATQHKESLKPFLKLRIDKLLSEFRHSYSNLSGMLLYLLGSGEVQNLTQHYPKLYSFYNSIQYKFLYYYFNLDQMPRMGLHLVCPNAANEQKVLMVDDLATEGWAPIVHKMIHGTFIYNRDNLLFISKKGPIGWINTIENKIKDFIPNLILLDLRLEDEKREQTLEKLAGFKILEFLKGHDIYKGIPVIIFTASANAENVKKLLGVGAEAVWTKPGLDEGLGVEDLKERYNQLVAIIESILGKEKFKHLKLFNDGTPEDMNLLNLQNLLLKKLDYVKYRYDLIGGDDVRNLIPLNDKCPFNVKINDFHSIYFDNNALMSGYWEICFEKLICSLLVLSMSVKDSTIKLKSQNNALTEYTVPKVVVMNVVYDELIKKAKVLKNPSKPKQCMRASTALMILKVLFENGFVRSEIRGIDESGNPIFFLANPKENVYADPFLLDEMFTITHNDERFKSIYETDQKVLVITGDSNLKIKLKTLKNVCILDTKDFVELLHTTSILK